MKGLAALVISIGALAVAEAEGINLILGAGASDEYTTQVSGDTRWTGC